MSVINYPVGDFLIRIKNAKMAGRRTVEVKTTKFIHEMAKALKKHGFLNEVHQKDGMLTVELAYHKKAPVILDLELVSRPGLRRYASVDEIEKMKGPETRFFSTSKGILAEKEALKERVGGEFLVKIL